MNTPFTGLPGSLLLGACSLFLASCAQHPTDHQAQTWDSHVVRGQLSNGLQYRLVRETSQPGRIDLRLTVKAGSVDETDQQVGVAHMVEHLNFHSHGGSAVDIRQQMNQWGWTQGRHYNAVTTYDRTQYLLSPNGGAGQTEQALQALATLTLAADYNANDLDQERPIVIEEWRGGLGVAQRMNEQRTNAQRIGSRYPEHRTIGNEAAIRAASLDELKAFQQRWYVPNNMVLSIVGDIDPASLPARIEHWFAGKPAGPLAERSWRELPLDNQLKIVGLQDSQSGSNQVALLLRMHEPASRALTSQGLRERLIDRFALALLVDQLRRQPLNEGVRSLTAQKNQIGEHSSVLGLAAGVQGQHHDAALRQLLTEIERLRRFGLQAADLDQEKASVREVAQHMLDKDNQRNFEQWVNDLNDAAIQNRLVMDKHEIARQYLSALDDVSLDDVNRRLRSWIDSADRVLQVTAAGGQKLQLPTRTQVQEQLATLRAEPLAAPQPVATKVVEQPQALPPLPAAGSSGKVLDQRSYASEKVEYWTLSNGDRLVWLKQAGSDAGMVLQAGSDAGMVLQAWSTAGFANREIPVWRSQVAAQLGQQQAPAGWSAEQFKRWHSEQGIKQSQDQQADHLQVSVSTLEQPKDLASDQRLLAMLQSYRLSQAPLALDEQDFAVTRDDLQSKLSPERESVRDLQQKTLSALRYGDAAWQGPSVSDLQQLQPAQLQGDWQRLTQAPVTYYLMADVDAVQLKALVEQHLASIPRGPALQAQPLKQRAGRHVQTLSIGLEPRSQLQAYSYHEQPWTPQDAARVAALQGMAQAALKQQLRGQAAGVYSLTFETSLDPRNQRIESKLNFFTDPARAEELWQLARQTLARLPQTLKEQDVLKARSELLRQERLRRSDPQTQLRRLVLSDQQWGDPRYLSEQQQLPEALTLAALKPLADKLFDERNLVLLRLDPVPQKAASAP